MNGAESAFGSYARAYDHAFTRSRIGTLQRRRVRNFIKKNIAVAKYPEILELNCGTGEDALWLSEQGFHITATDISEDMIATAKEKNKNAGIKIDFLRSDLREINSTLVKKKFNFIFSNFGGMNCISPEDFPILGDNLSNLLTTGGRFVAVVMGRNCLWEQFYFKRKKDFASAFRRRKKESINAVINGVNFPVWYYSPHEFADFFSKHFIIKQIKPIGIALPPSYLENYFRSKPILLQVLNLAENVLYFFSSLSDKADHYSIEFEKI